MIFVRSSRDWWILNFIVRVARVPQQADEDNRDISSLRVLIKLKKQKKKSKAKSRRDSFV